MNYHPACLLLLLAAFDASAAEGIYRCGNSYSNTRCPQAKVIDGADARSAEQRAEARRVAANDSKLGTQMERTRLAERREPMPLPATLGPTPAAEATQAVTRSGDKIRRTARRPPTLTTAHFTAVGRKSAKQAD